MGYDMGISTIYDKTLIIIKYKVRRLLLVKGAFFT